MLATKKNTLITELSRTSHLQKKKFSTKHYISRLVCRIRNTTLLTLPLTTHSPWHESRRKALNL